MAETPIPPALSPDAFALKMAEQVRRILASVGGTRREALLKDILASPDALDVVWELVVELERAQHRASSLAFENEALRIAMRVFLPPTAEP